MSRKILIVSAVFLFATAALVTSAQALSPAFTHQGKSYYVVTAADGSEDTGDEVCAKAGGQCIGYTLETPEACQFFHPDAALTSDSNGDASTVYCNGSPQSGICATQKDSCHSCPDCSAGIDCSTPVGSLYREMYVECGGGKIVVQTGGSFFDNLISQIRSFFTQIFSKIPGVQKGITNVITQEKMIQRLLIMILFILKTGIEFGLK